MNPDCTAFRARLELRLGRARHDDEARPLGPQDLEQWHAHLSACPDCRELLAADEALDLLLASLPDPQLPPELSSRVLACLVREREAEAALDELLELSRPVRVPSGLAQRVLAATSGAREFAGPSTERKGRRLAQIAALAAALVVIALGAWLALSISSRPGAPSRSSETVRGDTSDVDAPPDELLGSLDLLESWELLRGEDLDAALLSLEPIDEVLLELQSADAQQGEAPFKG